MRKVVWVCVVAGIFGVFMMTGARPHISSTENLLRNGSFEEESASGIVNEANYWKMGAPDEHGDYWGSASRENWRGVDGEFVGTIRGIWANYGHFGGMWQEVAAVPGRTYQFSGWFFCDAEWMARTQEIKLEFWSADYQETLHTESLPIKECDVDWEQLTFKAVAPANAAWVRVVINVNNVGAMGALQFDNLKLVMTDEP